jgi:hypothetical protein
MYTLFFPHYQNMLLDAILDLTSLAETTAAKPDHNPKYLEMLNKNLAKLTAAYNGHELINEERDQDESARYTAGFKAGLAKAEKGQGFNRRLPRDREQVRAESINRAYSTWQL